MITALITRITSEAVKNILGFELKHVGINEINENNAINSTEEFASLFSLPLKEGSDSIFTGTDFEITKTKASGAHGHLAIGTNNINRAMAYFKRKVISILPETAKEKNVKLTAVYLDKEISGFAIYLLQKS